MLIYKNRDSVLFRAIVIVLVYLFLANDIAIAQPSASTLAPLKVDKNPKVKREITASLYRASRLIWLANSPRYLDLLARYNALALLLPSGRYLMTPETAANDLLLIRSAIHEDNEILMQQEEKLRPTRYNRLMLQMLNRDDITKLYRGLSHYKEPDKEPDNIIFNDLVSKAFELLFIIDENLVYSNELKSEEKEFVALIRPILEAKDSIGRYKNFSQVFFDTDKRSKVIKALQEDKSKRFYRVANSPNGNDTSAYIPVSEVKEYMKSGLPISEVFLDTADKNIQDQLNELFGSNYKSGKYLLLFSFRLSVALIHLDNFSIDFLARDDKEAKVVTMWSSGQGGAVRDIGGNGRRLEGVDVDIRDGNLVGVKINIGGSEKQRKRRMHAEQASVDEYIELNTSLQVDRAKATSIIDEFCKIYLKDNTIFQYEIGSKNARAISPDLNVFIAADKPNFAKLLRTTKRMHDTIYKALDGIYNKFQKAAIDYRFDCIAFYFNSADYELFRCSHRRACDGTLEYAFMINMARVMAKPETMEQENVEIALLHEAGHNIFHSVEFLYQNSSILAATMVDGMRHPDIGGLKFNFAKYDALYEDHIEAVREAIANWFVYSMSSKETTEKCLRMQLDNFFDAVDIVGKDRPINTHTLANFVAVADAFGITHFSNVKKAESYFDDKDREFCRDLEKFVRGLRLVKKYRRKLTRKLVHVKDVYNKLQAYITKQKSEATTGGRAYPSVEPILEKSDVATAQVVGRLGGILNAVTGGQVISEADKEFILSESARYGYDRPTSLKNYLESSYDMHWRDVASVIRTLIFIHQFDTENNIAAPASAPIDPDSSLMILKDEAISHEYGHFFDALTICSVVLENFKNDASGKSLLDRTNEATEKLNTAIDVFSFSYARNKRPVLIAANLFAADEVKKIAPIVDDTIKFLADKPGDFKMQIKYMRISLDRVSLFLELLQKIGISISSPDKVFEFDINAMLKETAGVAFVSGLKTGRIKLNFKLDKNMPPALFYPQIWFVPMNLCSNAWNAGRKRNRNSEITIESLYDKDNGEIIFTVSDTGIGIPEENLKKIWEEGFTTVEGGTGRGLPLVKAIVSRHGGRISVWSTPGHGAAFTVRLPLYGRKFLEFLREYSEHELESIFERRDSISGEKVYAETVDSMCRAVDIYFQDIGIANLSRTGIFALYESQVDKNVAKKINDIVRETAIKITDDWHKMDASIAPGAAKNEREAYFIRRTLELRKKHMALADGLMKELSELAPEDEFLRDTARYFKNCVGEFFEELAQASAHLGIKTEASLMDEIRQASEGLNSEARKISPLNLSVSALHGTSQNLMDASKFRFCMPVEVLKNSPDIALALNSTGLLKQLPQDAENIEFELVVTGVTEEDIELIDGLNKDDIKKALNLSKRFTVSTITEAQIQETAKRFSCDASNPKDRVAIVKDFFAGALAKREYTAIATDAIDGTEKADLLKEELEKELKDELAEENISIRVLVKPESGKSIYSLSKIINDWLEAVNQGNLSTISKILPIPAPLTPELERAIKALWSAILIAA